MLWSQKEELRENRRCPNCACRVYIGAIKTLTVFTHFLLGLIEFQFRCWWSNRYSPCVSSPPYNTAAACMSSSYLKCSRIMWANLSILQILNTEPCAWMNSGMPIRRAFPLSRPLVTPGFLSDRIKATDNNTHPGQRGVGWEEYFFGMAAFVHQTLMHMRQGLFLVLWDGTVWHIEHRRGQGTEWSCQNWGSFLRHHHHRRLDGRQSLSGGRKGSIRQSGQRAATLKIGTASFLRNNECLVLYVLRGP